MRTRRTALPNFARTRWRFGYQTARVRLWAWLTLWPNLGPLPQNSQTLAMLFDSVTPTILPLVFRKRRHPSMLAFAGQIGSLARRSGPHNIAHPLNRKNGNRGHLGNSPRGA